MGNNWGDMATADDNGGNADASRLSIVLAMSKPPNHNDDSNDGNADAKYATRKKTLVSNATAAGNNGGNVDAGTSSIFHAVQWWWL